MKKIKRLVVDIVIWFMVGIMGGQMYLDQIHLFPLFLVGMILVIFLYSIRYGYKVTFIFLGVALLGIIYTIGHPIIKEQKYFEENQALTIEGEVIKVTEGAFNDTLTLGRVRIKHKNRVKAIRSKVNVKISKAKGIVPCDRLRMTGEVLPRTQKMNPSDMDYERYLISQGIVATLKLDQLDIATKSSFDKRFLKTAIAQRIDKIFQNQDQGIIKTMLIGNKENIPDEIQSIYSRTGIGHVLAISGFHIALLVSVLYVLLGYFGMRYTLKYMIICSSIWFYAYLTGASTSTIRACIMFTLVIIARCIWEEEDLVTNLAIAAGIILLINPFQLSQVGFQLSFVAVGSLLVSSVVIKKIEVFVSKSYLKLLYIFVPWLCVTLGISPILAFHFYEVPVVCALLNIILIPIFSIIIIVAWVSLGVSVMTLNGAVWIAKILIVILDTILLVGEQALRIPLGTLCTGRPSLLNIAVYYSLMILIICGILGYVKKKLCIYMTLASLGVCVLYTCLIPKMLNITYLYVGQGDGVVITTPHRKVIVIDAGNFGKGKVVEKYIKYKGKKTISAFILSHSDADHVGGLIDLLETDIKIENVFISKLDESPLMHTVLERCLDKKVNIYQVGYLDAFTIDNVQVTYLAPMGTEKETDNNNNSIGCLIQYQQFLGLFTGDMDKTKERQMCEKLESVTVLKVSHHGSKTGTDQEALLKIKPRYAIISCGINNRYNHPHKNTLNTLEKQQVDVLRTDQKGAIQLKTDGNKLFLRTQIKGD